MGDKTQGMTRKKDGEIVIPQSNEKQDSETYEFRQVAIECHNCKDRLDPWPCQGLAAWTRDGCKLLSDRLRTERDARLRRGTMLPYL